MLRLDAGEREIVGETLLPLKLRKRVALLADRRRRAAGLAEVVQVEVDGGAEGRHSFSGLVTR